MQTLLRFNLMNIGRTSGVILVNDKIVNNRIIKRDCKTNKRMKKRVFSHNCSSLQCWFLSYRVA